MKECLLIQKNKELRGAENSTYKARKLSIRGSNRCIIVNFAPDFAKSTI